MYQSREHQTFFFAGLKVHRVGLGNYSWKFRWTFVFCRQFDSFASGWRFNHLLKPILSFKHYFWISKVPRCEWYGYPFCLWKMLRQDTAKKEIAT